MASKLPSRHKKEKPPRAKPYERPTQTTKKNPTGLVEKVRSLLPSWFGLPSWLSLGGSDHFESGASSTSTLSSSGGLLRDPLDFDPNNQPSFLEAIDESAEEGGALSRDNQAAEEEYDDDDDLGTIDTLDNLLIESNQEVAVAGPSGFKAGGPPSGSSNSGLSYTRGPLRRSPVGQPGGPPGGPTASLQANKNGRSGRRGGFLSSSTQQRQSLAKNVAPQLDPQINGDENSDNSETSASTSGCSSLAPSHQERKKLCSFRALPVTQDDLQQIRLQLNQKRNLLAASASASAPGPSSTKEQQQNRIRMSSAEQQHNDQPQEQQRHSRRRKQKARDEDEDDDADERDSKMGGEDTPSTQTSLWSEDEFLNNSVVSMSGSIGPNLRSRFGRPQATGASKKPRFTLSSYGAPLAASARHTLFNCSLPLNAAGGTTAAGTVSPFYDGQTTFGGASAYRKARIGAPVAASSSFSAQNLLKQQMSNASGRITARARSRKEECMSSAAKKILQSLEKMSTPLSDARRIPTLGGGNSSNQTSQNNNNNNRTDFALSYTPFRHRPKQQLRPEHRIPTPVLGTPPTLGLVTPSSCVLGRNLQPMLQIDKRTRPMEEQEEEEEGGGTHNYDQHHQQQQLTSCRGKMDEDSETTKATVSSLATSSYSFGGPVASSQFPSMKMATTSGARGLGAASAPNLPAAIKDNRKSGGKMRSSGSLASNHYKHKEEDEDDYLSEPVLAGISLPPIGSLPKFTFKIPLSSSSAALAAPGTGAAAATIAAAAATASSTTISGSCSFSFSSPIQTSGSPPPAVLVSSSSSSSSALSSLKSPAFKFSSPALREETPPPRMMTYSSSLSSSSVSAFGLAKRKTTSAPLVAEDAQKEAQEETQLKVGQSVLDCLGIRANNNASSPSFASFSSTNNESTVKGAGSSPSPLLATAAASAVASGGTKLGFGSAFAPPAGSWTCSVCCIVNGETSLSCLACESPRPTPATAPPTTAPPIKPSSSSWSCSTCLVVNQATQLKCVCCEALPPLSASAPSLALSSSSGFALAKKTSTAITTVAPPPSSSWTCDTCWVVNRETSSSTSGSCVACSTPRLNRGGANSKSDPANSGKNASSSLGTFQFAANVSSPSASTFKFGIPSGDSVDGGPKKKTIISSSGFVFGAGSASSSPSSGAAPPSPLGGTPSFKFGVPATTTHQTSSGTAPSAPSGGGGFVFGGAAAKSSTPPPPSASAASLATFGAATLTGASSLKMAAEQQSNIDSSVLAVTTKAPSGGGFTFNDDNKNEKSELVVVKNAAAAASGAAVAGVAAAASGNGEENNQVSKKKATFGLPLSSGPPSGGGGGGFSFTFSSDQKAKIANNDKSILLGGNAPHPPTGGEGEATSGLGMSTKKDDVPTPTPLATAFFAPPSASAPSLPPTTTSNTAGAKEKTVVSGGQSLFPSSSGGFSGAAPPGGAIPFSFGSTFSFGGGKVGGATPPSISSNTTTTTSGSGGGVFVFGGAAAQPPTAANPPGSFNFTFGNASSAASSTPTSAPSGGGASTGELSTPSTMIGASGTTLTASRSRAGATLQPQQAAPHPIFGGSQPKVATSTVTQPHLSSSPFSFGAAGGATPSSTATPSSSASLFRFGKAQQQQGVSSSAIPVFGGAVAASGVAPSGSPHPITFGGGTGGSSTAPLSTSGGGGIVFGSQTKPSFQFGSATTNLASNNAASSQSHVFRFGGDTSNQQQQQDQQQQQPSGGVSLPTFGGFSSGSTTLQGHQSQAFGGPNLAGAGPGGAPPPATPSFQYHPLGAPGGGLSSVPGNENNPAPPNPFSVVGGPGGNAASSSSANSMTHRKIRKAVRRVNKPK